MGSKALVGMSGGVDSTVAAFCLKNQGFNLHGFTLRMYSEEGRCCSREDIELAGRAARRIGISHTVIDIRDEFEKEVVDYFLASYRQGRTPNPCAVCNQRIRFGSFWKQVDGFGADYLATGHYARIYPMSLDSRTEFFLRKAKDKKKSQEYFLALIPAEHLNRIIFPLGDMTKDEVCTIAVQEKLPHVDRESQDICFIPDGDTSRFLHERLGQLPGDIVDTDGRILGRHQGLWYYTIGQRKGMGIPAAEPLFVLKLDTENNRIVVGQRSDLAGDRFRLVNVNRFTNRDLSSLSLTCKIRYATPEVGCKLNGDKVVLDKSVDAITPGQLGVIYWEDKVVMAGTIATE